MLDVYIKIRRCRELLDMSQDELARRAGYTSRSTIARIEKGEIDLPLSKIQAIAKALKVDPAYLMGWKDEDGNEIPDDAFGGRDVLLLDIFAELNLDGQQKVLAYASDLAEMDKYKE